MKRVFILPCLILSLTPVSAFAGYVPDTGQANCHSFFPEIPCPQPGEPFYGQDAQYITNPHSYTKLGYGSVELPDNATEWIMVRDNVTGLIWEVKTDDGSIHDKDNSYTWYDSNPATNGGWAGEPGSGTDTEDFINDLNASQFGGYSDWRMPTIKELSFIRHMDRFDPIIDTIYFPNTRYDVYWSSTTYVYDLRKAWYFSFASGYMACWNKSNSRFCASRSIRIF